jgi:metallophosphoesterase superfamily enzyme
MKFNIFKNKKLIISISMISILLLSSFTNPDTQTNSAEKANPLRKAFNFIIVSDWGWNGFKHQQEVADQMGKTAENADAKFIVSCGDNFQVQGVASTQDNLWLVNFENIYKALSLQVNWYPVLGNHDYKGSTQAEIDYSKISRRWRLTDHYYTFSKKINDSISARFIFLDTPPFVEEYQKNPAGYPDIKQDTEQQLKWLEDVLSNSKEQWILVFGHHPIYSASKTHGNTKEMIAYVKPLLEKYHAQFYFCGHDHDLQHLREKGGKLDYIVSGTGGDTRPYSSNDMSVFSGSEPAFTLVSFHADSINIRFVGEKGNEIYHFNRNYK